MSVEVEVWVSERGADAYVGRLYSQRRRSTETASFVYDDSWLGRPDAYALDPALPLTSGAHHTAVGLALFNAFGDSAPDRWGRNLVTRAERLRASASGMQPRSLGEIEFVLGARDDLRQGALRFRDSDSGAWLASDDVGVPALADLPELLHIASRVEIEEVGESEIRRLLQAGSSLGGARPKTHVRNSDGHVAVAKFPSSSADTWSVAAWEKVALDLAAAAGIAVAPSHLIDISGRHVLIVDRFDRTRRGHRIGYVSALTMLEARDGDQRSYLDIAGVIEERSLSATGELAQLWRRMVFSVMISNTDDHLRNHGFLHTAGDAWTLSPAFDLNPNPAPGPRFLSTAIDEVETSASMALLMDVAPYFRLDKAAAVSVLREVAGTVEDWRRVAGGLRLSSSEISRMAPAFEHDAAAEARST